MPDNPDMDPVSELSGVIGIFKGVTTSPDIILTSASHLDGFPWGIGLPS